MKLENSYLTYKEYYQLGGRLNQNTFMRLEYKSELKVDEMSSHRFREISNYPNELKMCIFELIDTYKGSEDDSNILSESIGNYSVTKKSSKELEKERKSIIKHHLSEVKVNGVYALYCGW